MFEPVVSAKQATGDTARIITVNDPEPTTFPGVISSDYALFANTTIISFRYSNKIATSIVFPVSPILFPRRQYKIITRYVCNEICLH